MYITKTAKQSVSLLCLSVFLFFGVHINISFAATTTVEVLKTIPTYENIHAVYLTTGHVGSDKKVNELLNIIKTTGANGVVIDFKDSNIPKVERMKYLTALFKKEGAYTIARIVSFQDTYLARNHPDSAIKNSAGEFWYSGRKEWQRYWMDPASLFSQFYVIEIAKQAADAGFDEVQLDYVRFPTDGDMNDMVYPFYDPTKTTKTKVMNEFFARFKEKLFEHNPHVRTSIDIFGNVMTYGNVSGIGQDFSSLGDYFDVISPMPYPSHYGCGAFGFQDPTAYPYNVYYATQKKGLGFLKDKKAVIRPWIQDFSITSIYKCGPLVLYTEKRVSDEIRGGTDLGINGFMLWNASSNFTKGVFGQKNTLSTTTTFFAQ
jgi:hypothetical protein